MKDIATCTFTFLSSADTLPLIILHFILFYFLDLGGLPH